MTLRRFPSLLLGLALGLPAGFAAEAPTTGAGPWDDTWTMDLKDEERTYVDLAGTSYLMIRHEELQDRLFIDGKDVALNAKFATLDRNRPTFYRLDQLAVVGGDEHWARALDGDNLYLLGKVSFDQEGEPVLTIDHVVPAPSDAEIVAGKLAELAEDDYEGRLKVAEWTRKQSEVQGNRAWWLQAADDIVSTTVRAAADAAAAAQDLALLLKAMNWAIEESGDRELAAELGSQEWAVTSTDPLAAKINERMQTLGYVLHQGDEGKRWMTQAQALTSEYRQRMEDMHWRDAEGFYQLGRWADKHADVLPHARELAHEAYLKGQQADPRHAGIRRELGLPPVEPGTATSGFTLNYKAPSGLAIEAPQGWDRTAKPVTTGADVTWIDPRSDTAYIAASEVDMAGGADIDAVWRKRLEQLQIRPGFQAGAVQTGTHPEGKLRRMSYRLQSGDEVRPAELVVIYDQAEGYGVVLTASFVESEREGVMAALGAVERSVKLPQRPEPEAPAAAPDGAPAPAPEAETAPAAGGEPTGPN